MATQVARVVQNGPDWLQAEQTTWQPDRPIGQRLTIRRYCDSRLVLSPAQHQKIAVRRNPLVQEVHDRLDAPDVKNILVDRKPDVPDREITWQYRPQILVVGGDVRRKHC